MAKCRDMRSPEMFKRELIRLYGKKLVPITVLQGDGFPFYGNRAALLLWGKDLFLRGVNFLAGKNVIENDAVEVGLFRMIRLKGEFGQMNARLSPFISPWGEELYFLTGGAPQVDICDGYPYCTELISIDRNGALALPMEEAMFDLSLLRERVDNEPLLAEIGDALSAAIRKSYVLDEASRCVGTIPEKQYIDVEGMLRCLSKETDAVEEVCVETHDFRICIVGDEILLTAAFFEFIRGLSLCRSASDEKVRVRILCIYDTVEIVFSIPLGPFDIYRNKIYSLEGDCCPEIFDSPFRAIKAQGGQVVGQTLDGYTEIRCSFPLEKVALEYMLSVNENVYRNGLIRGSAKVLNAFVNKKKK